MDTKTISMDRPGWRLTFHDEFDSPVLNDLYWFPSYRFGRIEYLRRLGKDSLWDDPNAYYILEDSLLHLRIDQNRPLRPTPQTPCVSCITTSDHRFGANTSEVQVMDKFSQKYGYFEIRARCVRGSGLMCAFWLHQVDPLCQEFTPAGERKNISAGALEIDIFEQRGLLITPTSSQLDLNVHFTDNGHCLQSLPADVSANFHLYAMEWEEGCIKWYFDNTLLTTYYGPTPPQKMFLLAALFQYENWLGPIDPHCTYPQDFAIDYIRVYAKA